jgi:uncharacterized alpha-E superfamily protein
MGAEESLRVISGSPVGTYRSAAERSLGRLRSDLDYTDMDEVMRAGMHEWMDLFQVKLNDMGGAIHATFFALREVSSEGGHLQGARGAQGSGGLGGRSSQGAQG